MNRHAARLCAAAILGLVPAVALAQGSGSAGGASAERRPYRGIFAPPGDDQSQTLVFNGSVFSGYDENVASALTGSRRGADRRLQGSGAYHGAQTGLTYHLNPSARRVQFDVMGTAQASYYYYTDKWNMVPHYAGSARMNAPLGKGLSLDLGYAAVYAKNYRFLLFPDAMGVDTDGAFGGDPDNELFRRSTLRHAGDISLSKKLDTRSTLSLGYSARYVEFVDQDFAPYRRQTASINFDRRMTANATMNLGYGYTTGDSGVHTAEREVHHINAGVNYSRALSFSRRTSFSFSTGSGYIAREDVATDAPSTPGRLRFLGSATLTHEMGRTWTASAAYVRRFVFREGFEAPFFTDGVTAQVAGFITRRLDATAQASWALARYQGREGGQHRGTWAVAQLRYGLTPWLAAYARYVYYDYRFSDEIPLDAEFPALTDRQGVRAGLSLSVPLM